MSSVVLSGDTSGAITISAPAVAGTNTITLPANTGTVITTASSGQSIPKAALPTGSVLQVVSATISSIQATSSTSFVASTLIATITPSSATSKILIFLNGGQRDSNSTGNIIQTAMYRNVAGAGYSSLSLMELLYFNSGNASGGHSFNYLDSPATTSSISYQPYFKVAGGTGSVYFNYSSNVVSLTLMEIAA